MKFQCSQCGACCRRAGSSGLMPDRGDGACIYLRENNLCDIYDERPEICNMEKMFLKRKEEFPDINFSKIDYFKLNNEVCNQMMDEDGITDLKIDLTLYDG